MSDYQKHGNSNLKTAGGLLGSAATVYVAQELGTPELADFVKQYSADAAKFVQEIDPLIGLGAGFGASKALLKGKARENFRALLTGVETYLLSNELTQGIPGAYQYALAAASGLYYKWQASKNNEIKEKLSNLENLTGQTAIKSKYIEEVPREEWILKDKKVKKSDQN